MCKQDITQWQPDVVILVDYPGFNLKIAEYVKAHAICPVYYYIAPKIWAWKEYRIKNIKRDVDELFSIPVWLSTNSQPFLQLSHCLELRISCNSHSQLCCIAIMLC